MDAEFEELFPTSQIISSAQDFLDSISKRYLKPNMTLAAKLQFIRESIMSRRGFINEKPIFSNDWTASGQSMEFVNSLVQEFQVFYANTHSEDNFTADFSTEAFHSMIDRIKKMVKLEDGFLIPFGNGATGVMQKLHEILGLFIPPSTRVRLNSIYGIDIPDEFQEADLEKFPDLPICFVGPYEHHSNDVPLRKGIALVIRINMIEDESNEHFTEIDYEDLEAKLQKYSQKSRYLFGFFSAGSNVTGLKTDIGRLTEMLHKYNAKSILDYAAIFPYVNIDMQKNKADAIFIATHKLIPDTPGILLARNSLYRLDLHPTMCGGGTFTFVTKTTSSFVDKIEERELAGSPNGQGMLKVLVAFMIREWIGYDAIEKIENSINEEMMPFLQNHPKIKLLGNQDPHKRIAIYSCLIRHGKDRQIHPKFVARILSDLFGVQIRPGCSCAGPFGAFLLGISDGDYLDTMGAFLVHHDLKIAKLGWARFGIHWSDSKDDIAHTKFAFNAIAWFGHLFLEDYQFHLSTTQWFPLNQIPLKRFIISQKHKIESARLKGAKEMRHTFLTQVNHRICRVFHQVLVKHFPNAKKKCDETQKSLETFLKKNKILKKFIAGKLASSSLPSANLVSLEALLDQKVIPMLDWTKESQPNLLELVKNFLCEIIGNGPRNDSFEYFDSLQPFVPWVVLKQNVHHLDEFLANHLSPISHCSREKTCVGCGNIS